MLTFRRSFNAIIEGGSQGNWRDLNYKVARIKIPKEAYSLYDDTYKYVLYGKTEKFDDIKKSEHKEGGLEINLNSLTFSKGLIIPFKEGDVILERPRSVCMKDGRIYIEEGMLKDEDYLEALSYVLDTANKVFNKRSFSKIYRKFNHAGWTSVLQPWASPQPNKKKRL